MVKLNHTVTLTPFIGTVTMANASMNFDSRDTCFVTGFGKTIGKKRSLENMKMYATGPGVNRALRFHLSASYVDPFSTSILLNWILPHVVI